MPVTTKKTAQDIQDDIFRKMPVAKKIRLASSFYRFGQELHKLGRQRHGTGRIAKKNR